MYKQKPKKKSAPTCSSCDKSLTENSGKRIYREDIQNYESEFINWICQKCSGVSLCKSCGEALVYCHGKEIMDDDQSVLHCMLIPASVGCVNSECDNYHGKRKNRTLKFKH